MPLRLAAPDWAALDSIWQNPDPFILWYIGNQTLLCHWMDEAVRRGVEEVEIYVADRPAEVRAWLDEGTFWSRRIKVIPIGREGEAPADAERIAVLPGEVPLAADPVDASALLQYWFELQKKWLAQRMSAPAQLDQVHASGGWVGPRAVISPAATLAPPFWIGAGARIGAQCKIGPNAFVSRGAIIDEDVEIEEAFVTHDTYVGKHTRVGRKIVTGKFLIDLQRGGRVEIGERFILAPLSNRSSRSKAGERLAALAAWLLLAPLAEALTRGHWVEREVETCDGEKVMLRTGEAGPLWARRWPWLWQIAAGRMRWIGVLPRGHEDWSQMPAELSGPVRNARAGIFSLADLHACHTAADPGEWIHASYQAQRVDPKIPRQVLRNLWKIAWSQCQTAPSATK